MAGLAAFLLIFTTILIYLEKKVHVFLHGIKNFLHIAITKSATAFPKNAITPMLTSVIVITFLSFILGLGLAYIYSAVTTRKYQHTKAFVISTCLILLIIFVT